MTATHKRLHKPLAHHLPAETKTKFAVAPRTETSQLPRWVNGLPLQTELAVNQLNAVPLNPHQSVQVTLPEPKIQQKSAPFAVQLKPDEPSATMQERIDRIEGLIKKDYGKYIDQAKFKSPLKERIVWYSEPKELFAAKMAFARELAERDVSQLTDEEKAKEVEKHKGMVLGDATFENVKEYIISAKQTPYFRELGGDDVPAFYNHLTGKIYTTSLLVGVIAHEAFHSYDSREFRDVFGADLDEGMTQYLAEEIESSYSSAYSKEGGIAITIPSSTYAQNATYIENYIKSGKLAKDNLLKGYFMGGKPLVVNIKKMMEKPDPGKQEGDKKGKQSIQKGTKGSKK